MSESIVVIGGGAVGLALAWRLAREGANVTAIDAGPSVPSATQVAAGMLAPSFEFGRGWIAGPLYEMCLASLRRWPDFASRLETETGLSVDFRRDGALGLAFDAAEAEELAESANAILAAGGNVRLFNREALKRKEPLASARAVSALWAPEDAQVDPRRMIVALRRAIKRNGGELIDGKAVAVLAKNGAVDSVQLQSGEKVKAAAAVVAAGVFANEIRTEAPAAPVHAVKGEALIVQTNDAGPRVVVRTPRVYLCPKAEGRLYIGATQRPHVTSLDPSPDAIAALRAAAAEAVPMVMTCPELERFAGLRPSTPDGGPIIGRDPRGPEGLYFALGHHRNGVLLAPETAERLASIILQRGGERALWPFRPDRFPALGES